MNKKKAVLVVSFGTSYRETYARTMEIFLEHLEEALEYT